MGNTQSKTKHESTSILDVSPLTPVEEAKKKYLKLFYKYQRDNDTLVRLNDEFNNFKSNIDVDLYYELFTRVLDNEKSSFKGTRLLIEKSEGCIKVGHGGYFIEFSYLKTTKDFFEKLCNFYEVKAPVTFLDADFPRFYRFWAKITMKDKESERKIRKIVSLVKANDPRYQQGEIKVVERKVSNPERILEKKIKTWKIYCTVCNKGFNNENTLKDHLSSKNHKSKTVGLDAGGIIRRNESAEIIEEEIEPAKPKKPDHEPLYETVESVELEKELPVVLKEKEAQKAADHPMFRTCGVCKEVLDSRRELIMHLKSIHNP
ncbi:hypothetical protein GINT2_001811 [Glugoides intestinalis]